MLGLATHVCFSLTLSHSEHITILSSFSTLQLLFAAHLLRRIVECYFLERPSDSRMSVVHYLVGISFYPMVSLAMANQPSAVLSGGRAWQQYAALCLFMLSSALQTWCHWCLAALRARGELTGILYDRISLFFFSCHGFHASLCSLQHQPKGTPCPSRSSCFSRSSFFKEILPCLMNDFISPASRVWPFTITACPHYSAEVLLYFAMAHMTGWSLDFALILAFVVTNLSVGAVQVRAADCLSLLLLHTPPTLCLSLSEYACLQTLKWYQREDPSYTTKYAIVPGIL